MDKKIKVIAFTGAKGCGKDTVAEIIRRWYAHDWHSVTQLAFADPIKKQIQFLFGLSNVYEYDAFKRTTLKYMGRTMEGRHLVREIGMMMRGYDPKQFNAYVEKHFNQPENHLGRKLFLVTDMRFDNEYTMLREYGATIVKVSRPNHEYDGHITERGFDDHLVDYHIVNDGSLEDLTGKVQLMLKSIEG
jgi:hypothetical protein